MPSGTVRTLLLLTPYANCSRHHNQSAGSPCGPILGKGPLLLLNPDGCTALRWYQTLSCSRCCCVCSRQRGPSYVLPTISVHILYTPRGDDPVWCLQHIEPICSQLSVKLQPALLQGFIKKL